MRTIAIFDSGVGGLTVMRAIKDTLPHCNLVYLGDTARVPYGTKSKETILRYSLQVSQFLYAQGVDLLVIACNTATAYGLHEVRARYPIPVIGVIEPGIDATLQTTTGGKIGVIGTSATIASGLYKRGIQERLPAAHVTEIATPLLVPLVEENWTGTEVTRLTLERYLSGFPAIDTLVLGCTHYPLLKNDIANVLPEVALVDSALATARVVAGLAGQCSERQPRYTFYMTDTSSRFREIATLFFGEEIASIEHIDL